MSDVAQKIISSRQIQNGRAVAHFAGLAQTTQFGGWSGVMFQVPLDDVALEARLTKRFDEWETTEQTVNTFDTVRNIVNQTAAPITGLLEGNHNLNLKAFSTNTGTIYIGTIGVTAGTAQPTDGYPLKANESFTLPINQTGVIYAIASDPAQQLYIAAF